MSLGIWVHTHYTRVSHTVRLESCRPCQSCSQSACDKPSIPVPAAPTDHLRAVSLHAHTGVHAGARLGRFITLMSQHWTQMETWADSGGCWSQPASVTAVPSSCTTAQGPHGQAASEISLTLTYWWPGLMVEETNGWTHCSNSREKH